MGAKTTAVAFISSADIAEMRSAAFKRMHMTGLWLEDTAMDYGIAPSSTGVYGRCQNPWRAAYNADMAMRMRRAVPMSRAAVAAQYRPTVTERSRINDALHALAYGRRTRTGDIIAAVSAVHGALSHALTVDPPTLSDRSHTGHSVRMVGRYALVLDWYQGALEVAYLG